jgi:fatty-acyl-CoA synthase
MQMRQQDEMPAAKRHLTMAGMVREAAARRPQQLAIRLDNATRSYAELVANAERRARQILALGAGRGDRIGILLPNALEYIEIVLGAAMLGVIAVPMNIRFKALELRHLVVDSGMTALFTQSGIGGVVDFHALLCEALPDLTEMRDYRSLSLAQAPALRAIVALDDAFLPDAGLELPPGALPEAPEAGDPALLMYTSGTTANPKGCVMPNRAILSNAWAIVDRFALTDQDIWWCPLPMFHIGGLLFLLTTLAAGGIYTCMSHFDPEKALHLLELLPPTIFYPLFPTITLALTEHPRFAKLDLRGLRYAFSVAPEDVQRKIQAAVPQAPVLGAFGMTETCGTVAYGAPEDSETQRLTRCGRPLPGWKIKIVDLETRAALPAGIRGEIAVRGVGLFQGYFNEPDLTRQQFLDDGYFLTGDVGALDEAGFLSFHGRFKDQLKVGGENVSALEVESFLASHPAINLAQVVGIPDAKYGEVPAAFIELKQGRSIEPEAVIAFCTDRIARFKVPRYVRIVEEWPMSATKIVKFRLRERLLAELNEAR